MWAYNGHVQSYMHCAMLKSITWVYGTCDLVLLSIHSICLIEYCHGYGRWAVPYMVIACAVLASLLDTTYDGGEWEPGYVIVLSTWIFFTFLLWVLLLTHFSSVFPSYTAVLTVLEFLSILHHIIFSPETLPKNSSLRSRRSRAVIDVKSSQGVWMKQQMKEGGKTL